MTTKSQKIRVGVFTIVTVALAALVLVVFGGVHLFSGTDHYKIRFSSSVMGLERGALVYLEGIKVGQVDSIDVAPDDLGKVDVEIHVAEGTPVHTDTKATLQFAGITGLKVIDLEGGTYQAPRLAEGGTIAQGQGLLDKFQKQAETLADQSAQLMQKANKIVENVVVVTDPKRFAVVDDVLAQAHTTSTNLAMASATLKTMVGENRVALRQSLDAVRDTAQSANEVIDGQIAQLATNANDLVSQIKTLVTANEGPLRSAVFDLRQASRSFKELARDVRQRPSRLLFSSAPEERKLP